MMYKEIFWAPFPNFAFPIIIVLFVWSLFWKGLSLWRAAKNSQKYWFFFLLIFNTVGILEIIYLAFFQKKNKK